MTQAHKVVSTRRKLPAIQRIRCRNWGARGVDGVLVIYYDGSVEVHCEGNCHPCRHG
jgi:hypothetical protein